jgi:hypothetical protein
MNSHSYLSCRIFSLMAALIFVASVACASDDPAQNGHDDSYAERGMMSGPRRDEKTGLTIIEIDINGDGRADVFKYVKPIEEDAQPSAEEMLHKEMDLNSDGKIDVWTDYSEDGLKTKESFDLDFDGRVDMVDLYTVANEQAVLVKREIDFQFDERPDIWQSFSDGELYLIEKDTNNDGLPDYWEYWAPKQACILRLGRDIDFLTGADGKPQPDEWPIRRDRCPTQEELEAERTQNEQNQQQDEPEPEPAQEPEQQEDNEPPAEAEEENP